MKGSIAGKKILVALLFVVLVGTIFGLMGCKPKEKPTVRGQQTLKERQAQVTMKFNLATPKNAKVVKLWIPYPVSDENQDIEDIKIDGNFANNGVYRESKNGNISLFAEWNGTPKPVLTYTFKVKRKEVAKNNFPEDELPLSKEEFKNYLKATSRAPVTGEVKKIAEKITKNETTTLGKAKAIYKWIIFNMSRDPDVKGCGTGECRNLLGKRSGKCADIHAVFSSLSRSVGVPAREIFGIRIPKEKSGDMTKSQHCWAEFYLPGYGWVPVDPSDVRKTMLEKNIKDPNKVKDLVDYYFGSIDESRIAYQAGKDIVLNPPQSGGNLNYFMYPYAEVDGDMLNEDLFGFNIGYEISFKEL